MINSYSFGHIEVDGGKFDTDIIIYPDGRVEDSWWRKSGHTLALEDIADLVAAGPDVIIAGTGSSGMMNPEPGIETELARKGIILELLPTKRAIERYNALAREEKKVGACFHLTC